MRAALAAVLPECVRAVQDHAAALIAIAWCVLIGGYGVEGADSMAGAPGDCLRPACWPSATFPSILPPWRQLPGLKPRWSICG
jgi:hypothetical protein